MIRQTLFLLLNFFTLNALCQKTKILNKINWSGQNRLTLSDFTIRKTDSTQETFGASFIMEYHSSLFSTKSMSKQIHNFMLKEASWVDTSQNYNVERQIRFLQDLFDINEIHIRKLRKKVEESFSMGRALKKYYLIYVTEASKMQQQYKSEILYAKDLSDSSKQIKWEEIIRKQLDELSEYSINKEDKAGKR